MTCLKQARPHESRPSVRSLLTRGALAAVALWVSASGVALAQATYPNKPVRMIVPFPAGGSADLVARSIAQRFFENTKQPMVIENRPGADTIIGMEAVKASAPDGYTVGYAIGSSLTMNPALYSKLPYDPVRDFTPVMVIANVPLALAVNPAVPARTAKELAALIKAKPDELMYGQANILSRVGTEAFALAAGGKMTGIPYKGSSGSTQALLTGEVNVTIDPIVSLLPHMQAGKVRVLAMTGSRRAAAFPDIPTVAESGLPGYAFDNWHAILLPANTPRDIVQRLHAELVKAARHPDVAAKVAPAGVEIVAGTPEELQARATSEREHWSRQIRALGIKAD
jgi:tripartite-type tricarboxylate transporter receptor subunit TctC